jgi:hypothetical protein
LVLHLGRETPRSLARNPELHAELRDLAIPLVHGTKTTHGTEETTRHQAGFLTLGSTYSPNLPGPFRVRPVAESAFVPVYSGGTVTESHRLPFYTRDVLGNLSLFNSIGLIIFFMSQTGSALRITHPHWAPS